MAYATDTGVSIAQTRAEIEALLDRMGADLVMVGIDKRDNVAGVQFRMQDRLVRFRLSMPPLDDYRRTPGRGLLRSRGGAAKAHDQACRSRWRGLLLCIRAKLEAVESGIETIEEAFMAQVVLPDNTTVGQRMLPAITDAYRTGGVPSVPLLGDGRWDGGAG